MGFGYHPTAKMVIRFTFKRRNRHNGAMKYPLLSFTIVLALSLGALGDVYAGSATWATNPTSGDWNTAANWRPETVPNSETDVATFGQSNVTNIALSQT